MFQASPRERPLCLSTIWLSRAEGNGREIQKVVFFFCQLKYVENCKDTQTFCCFCAISEFFCRHKESDKKSKKQDQDSERHNFLLSDQKELTVKDSVEVISLFSSKLYWKKTTFLGGIISKFLLISNFLQSLSGSQDVCVQSVKMWSHFCEKVAHKSISKTAAPSFDDHDHIHCCYVFVNNCGSGIVLNWNPSVFYDHVIFVYIFWQPGTFWRRTTSRFIKKWNWTTAVVDATWYSRTPLGTGLRSTGLKIHLGKISTKLPSHWLVGTFTNNQKCKLSIMQNNILVPFIA